MKTVLQNEKQTGIYKKAEFRTLMERLKAEYVVCRANAYEDNTVWHLDGATIRYFTVKPITDWGKVVANVEIYSTSEKVSEIERIILEAHSKIKDSA